MDGQPTPPQHDESEEYVPQSRLDYLHTVNPRPKKRWWLRGLLALLVVAGLAAGGWYFFQTRADNKPEPASVRSAPKTSMQGDKAVMVETEHYDSATFNLGFDYPKDWTVTDKGDGKLTVISPGFKGENAIGQTETMQTVVTIAPKGQNLAPFDKGSALAVRTSEKIKYTNPTSVQRAETYLTFVQYSTTARGGGLDALYITGDFGYQKDQYIPKTDMVKLDPLLSVAFEKCADSNCKTTAPVATSVPVAAWSEASFSKPILTLLTSLAVN